MKLKHFKTDYNSYFDRYLKNIKIEEDCFDRLNNNLYTIARFFNGIEDEYFQHSYADNKWTVGQVLQHIIDTERIFTYRALKIVREKNPEIRSYDHEDYADSYKPITKDTLISDYTSNRKASITLFKTFDDQDLQKSIDNELYSFKVGLIPFIFCGHELHHMAILKEKYLG